VRLIEDPVLADRLRRQPSRLRNHQGVTGRVRPWLWSLMNRCALAVLGQRRAR
jgi:hypothetical protein